MLKRSTKQKLVLSRPICNVTAYSLAVAYAQSQIVTLRASIPEPIESYGTAATVSAKLRRSSDWLDVDIIGLQSLRHYVSPWYFSSRGSSRLSVASQTWRGPSNHLRRCATSASCWPTYSRPPLLLLLQLRLPLWLQSHDFYLFSSFLLEKSDRHRRKPILVCCGHVMNTPTLIAGREAILEFFLRQKLL